MPVDEHEYDVLIVGGGPAGMAAASTAADAGLRTVLIDERPTLGGQVYKQPGPGMRVTDAKAMGKQYLAGRELIDEAERKVDESSQMFPFTREICKRIALEDRSQIIEMLWKVAYADGVLDPYEDMLLRRIAGLIHVPDRERSLARQRALKKLAAGKPGEDQSLQ